MTLAALCGPATEGGGGRGVTAAHKDLFGQALQGKFALWSSRPRPGGGTPLQHSAVGEGEKEGEKERGRKRMTRKEGKQGNLFEFCSVREEEFD